MYSEDDIRLAHRQGGAVGEIALAEFILKQYSEDISPMLSALLQKVADDGYRRVAVISDKPAEDIALATKDILDKIMNS